MAEDIYDNYEALSVAAAQHFIEVVNECPGALISLATGSSPQRLYELIALAHQAGEVDLRHIRCVALDEWYGIPRLHAATCAAYIEKHVVSAWGLDAAQLQFFNAEAASAARECERIQAYLIDNGPIDLCILGLGRNGHLGLNEPGDALQAAVHVAELDELSQNHAMLANEGLSVTQGMTIGLSDIMSSKSIMMLICGKDKAAVYKQLLSGAITTQVPASFLHLHPCVYNFIDQHIADQ